MQVLDKVVYDALITKMVVAAYGGIGRSAERKMHRRKRMERALAAALKHMGLTLGELP